MKFSRRYHPDSFLAKILLGKMLQVTGESPYKSGELLVLNYHSTPEWLSKEFEKQVQLLSRHFTLVTPGYINNFYEKPESQTGKPALLFTFDDGLKNNMHAARVLEKFNVRGLFFLVPAFLDAPKDKQEDYYLRNIRNIVNRNIDTTSDDVTAMNAQDVSELLKKGHAIGSHSFTHTMKHEDDSDKNIVEIINSRQFLEERFKVPIENFCAPFDSLYSTGKNQMDLIKSHYKYFHSTFPGPNNAAKEPFFIKRVNIECWWPETVMRFALSGFEWKRWSGKREQFQNQVLSK